MQSDHTPNQFPFSTGAGGAPLVQAAAVFTSRPLYTVTNGGSTSGVVGGGPPHPEPGRISPSLLTDPAGLLDAACSALRQEEGFAEGAAPLLPASELADAVSQYVQRLAEPRPPARLMEVRPPPADGGRTPCFVCDGAEPEPGEDADTAPPGQVDLFGETNILAASKTPLCVRLEAVLGTRRPLQPERVHCDVVCMRCADMLEEADLCEVRLQTLRRQLDQLCRRLRRNFARTVRRHLLRHAYPDLEPEPDTEAELDRGVHVEPTPVWAGDDDPDDPGEEARPALPLSVAEDGSVSVLAPAESADAAADDDRSEPASTEETASTTIRRRPGIRATRKEVVPVRADPSRTRTRYVYEPQHSCDVCGKQFAWRGHLAKHRQTHTGERPLSCEQCGQTFRWSSHLTAHLRRHSGRRPFVCNVCGKAFVSSSVHRVHMRTHTDEKPFMCGVCGRQFADKSNLKTHEWVHTDVRPHNCEPCGRGFLTTSALKVHNRTIHASKPDKTATA